MSTRAMTSANRIAALAVLILSVALLSGCGVAMPTAPTSSNDPAILTAPHNSALAASSSKMSTGDEGESGGSDGSGSGTIQTNPNDTLPNSTPLGAPQAPTGGGPGQKHGHGRHHRRH
jgi:hypothetical protein